MQIDHSVRCAWRSDEGFTLIELLVVISIIALLISILLPVLGTARGTARDVKCLSNTRSIATANYQYAIDFKKYIGYVDASHDRKTLLYPYISQGLNNSDASGDQVWNCPSNQRPTKPDGTANEAGYGFNTLTNFAKPDAVKNPTKTVEMGDGGINENGIAIKSTHLMGPGYLATPGGVAYNGSNWNTTCARPNPRHAALNSANVGWIDGHSSLMKIEAPFFPAVPDSTLPTGTAPAWWSAAAGDPADPGYLNELWDLN